MGMNTIRITRLSLLLLVFVSMALAGCSFLHSDPLDGSTWELQTIQDSPPLSGSKITLSFDNGQLQGSAGCNQYGGDYQVDEDSIAMIGLYMTEMACLTPPGILEQEGNYLRLLGQVQGYQIQGNTLMLFVPDGEALNYSRVR